MLVFVELSDNFVSDFFDLTVDKLGKKFPFFSDKPFEFFFIYFYNILILLMVSILFSRLIRILSNYYKAPR